MYRGRAAAANSWSMTCIACTRVHVYTIGHIRTALYRTSSISTAGVHTHDARTAKKNHRRNRKTKH